MKFLRETLFNRIFHKAELKKQRLDYERVCKTLAQADEFSKALDKCDSLIKMMAIHKDMWGSNFRNSNIGPNDCGYFRCKDILTMKPEEVYLGAIYGLNTFTIPQWEDNRNALYGANGFGLNPGVRLYDLILQQYRDHLKSNLLAIVQPEKEWLEEWNKT